MARKKVEPIKFIEHTYYVYYDMDTGAILSASNELNDNYTNKLIVDYSTYDSFVSGRELFSDWVVIRSKNPDLADCMEIVPKLKQEIYFKNNLFVWISDPQLSDTECKVLWTSDKAKWTFSLGGSVRLKIQNHILNLPSEMSFYITLNNDLDFIIREIKINPKDLMAGNVDVPFEHDAEYYISKIGISTRRIFDSYSLSLR